MQPRFNLLLFEHNNTVFVVELPLQLGTSSTHAQHALLINIHKHNNSYVYQFELIADESKAYNQIGANESDTRHTMSQSVVDKSSHTQHALNKLSPTRQVNQSILLSRAMHTRL